MGNEKTELARQSMAWLHDIFVWGDVWKKMPKRDYTYDLMYNSPVARDKNSPETLAAKTICTAILTRKVSFKNFEAIDKALAILTKMPFSYLDADVQLEVATVDGLLNLIVYFCEKNKIYWPNNNISVYEMKSIIEHTQIGKKLWAANLFTVEKNFDWKEAGGDIKSPEPVKEALGETDWQDKIAARLKYRMQTMTDKDRADAELIEHALITGA